MSEPERVRQTLDTKFAAFLKSQRGTLSYAQFGKKVGLNKSSVYRFEQGHQSASLKTVQQILERLKCDATDIFVQ